MFINKEILQEIDDKKKYLENLSFLEKKLNILAVYSIFEEALHHSARIEYPFLELYKESTSKQKKDLRKEEYHQALTGLREARVYGLNNFKLPFKEEFVKNIVSKILGKETNYRRITLGVRPEPSKTTPPYPAKVPLEIERFKKGLTILCEIKRKKKPSYYVDLAVLTHFHIVRIHPFEDGNGRTARLLQNLILEKNKYPNIVIKEGERSVYHQLLDNACYSFKKREADLSNKDKLFNISRDEKYLFDFLGSKVIVALDDIIEGKYTF
jgi:Fic family protein